MSDNIACFPLRDATQEQLGTALGQSHADFWSWSAQAATIESFVHDARAGGVKAIVAQRLRWGIELGEAEGFLRLPSTEPGSVEKIVDSAADGQIAIAEQGGKIAAIVIMHNACERFLWRLVRLGVVANRPQAIEWIINRKVTLGDLETHGRDASVDHQIEKWWTELERGTMEEKWDCLVGLFGYPTKLDDPPWRFNKEMLLQFDHVRHNAVHHDAEKVKAFDFRAFAEQLLRANFVWLAHVAKQMNLRLSPESIVVPP